MTDISPFAIPADLRLKWSEERTAEMRQLRDGGMSTRDLMARYGLSRNAILGKLHRMGMLGQQNPRLHICRRCRVGLDPERKLRYCPSCQAERRAGWRKIPEEKHRRRLWPQSPDLAAEVLPDPDLAINPVCFAELERHHCRWPIDGGLYCGNETLAPPYCPGHRRMAYRPDRWQRAG